MASDELKARARRIAQELLTQGDLAVAAEIFALTCVHYGPGGTGTTQWIVALRRAFPDLRAMIEDELAEADTVAQRLTLVGTNDGAFLGNPPTGRRASWQVGVILHADRAGTFTELWTLWDQVDLLRQLGAAPGWADPP